MLPLQADKFPLAEAVPVSCDHGEGFPSHQSSEDIDSLTAARVLDIGALGADGLLFRTRNALSLLRPGEVLELRSSRLETEGELAPWLRLKGHTLLTAADAGGHTRFFIRAGVSRYEARADWGQQVALRSGDALDLRDWMAGRLGDIPDDARTYMGFVPAAVCPRPAPSCPSTRSR
jgi:TusA-related sulfurtransferase